MRHLESIQFLRRNRYILTHLCIIPFFGLQHIFLVCGIKFPWATWALCGPQRYSVKLYRRAEENTFLQSDVDFCVVFFIYSNSSRKIFQFQICICTKVCFIWEVTKNFVSSLIFLQFEFAATEKSINLQKFRWLLK